MFVFDITKRDTFEEVQHFIEGMANFWKPDISAVLIGNKNDLESDREVSSEEGEVISSDFVVCSLVTNVYSQDLATRYGLRYLEVSAKTGHNVEDAFATLADRAYDNIPSYLRGNWNEHYVFVTPEMWTTDAIDDSAALVVTL